MNAQLWVALVVSLSGAVTALGGLAALFLIPAQRRKFYADSEKTDAETRRTISETAGALIDQALSASAEQVKRSKDEADEAERAAAEARREASEARREATEAHRQMASVRADLTRLADFARWVVRSIHDPGMDIDRLRALVPQTVELPPANGRMP